MDENKNWNLTFLGGGRVTQNILRSISQTYFEHYEVLPNCQVNVVFPENSLTYDGLKDSLDWSQMNLEKIRFNLYKEDELSKIEKILNETNTIISAFTISKLSDLTKLESPRFAETKNNSLIAKKYIGLINTDNKNWINVSNQSDVLGSIIHDEFKKKNLEIKVSSFGLKLDQIRMNAYLQNKHDDENYIIRREYQNKIKVYGLHGRPIIITNNALEFMQKKIIEKYDSEYQKILQEEKKALKYLFERPTQIIETLKYIPDIELGKEVFNLCLSENGLLENISENIKTKSYGLIRNPGNFASRPISTKKIIDLYEKTIETYLENKNIINNKLITKDNINTLQENKNELFFGGNFEEIGEMQLSKNDKYMTAVGLIHCLKIYYDSLN